MCWKFDCAAHFTQLRHDVDRLSGKLVDYIWYLASGSNPCFWTHIRDTK